MAPSSRSFSSRTGFARGISDRTAILETEDPPNLHSLGWGKRLRKTHPAAPRKPMRGTASACLVARLARSLRLSNRIVAQR